MKQYFDPALLNLHFRDDSFQNDVVADGLECQQFYELIDYCKQHDICFDSTVCALLNDKIVCDLTALEDREKQINIDTYCDKMDYDSLSVEKKEFVDNKRNHSYVNYAKDKREFFQQVYDCDVTDWDLYPASVTGVRFDGSKLKPLVISHDTRLRLGSDYSAFVSEKLTSMFVTNEYEDFARDCELSL